MKLANFELVLPEPTVMLAGLGHFWDLHNFARFDGLEFRPADDAVILKWSAAEVDNPWGSDANPFRGCLLLFTGLRGVHIQDRDRSKGDSDSDLADLSRVTPEAGVHRMRTHWRDDSEFHLLFEFMSGRAIEIAADQAELRGIR